MASVKLTNDKLHMICYTLGSYDIEAQGIETHSNYLWLFVKQEHSLIPFFVLDEIREYAGDDFLVTWNENGLSLFFEVDPNEKSFSIPDDIIEISKIR